MDHYENLTVISGSLSSPKRQGANDCVSNKFWKLSLHTGKLSRIDNFHLIAKPIKTLLASLVVVTSNSAKDKDFILSRK